MDDDRGTKRLVCAILGGFLFLTSGVVWAGGVIGATSGNERESMEVMASKALTGVFFLSGLFFAIRALWTRADEP
jgi:hypothetical protein